MYSFLARDTKGRGFGSRPFHLHRVSQLVLLDLSAAFDMVDHQVLLCVLSDRFGISGTALNWFESYLSDWTRSFVNTGHTTAYFPVTGKGKINMKIKMKAKLTTKSN